jgi:hypothetical protein
MKKKPKPLFKFITFVAIVTAVAMLLWQVPAASNWFAGVIGTTGEAIRNTAATIVGIGIGVMLISFGVAALSVPVLGVVLVVIGLAMLGYSLWPLFKPRSQQNATGEK